MRNAKLLIRQIVSGAFLAMGILAHAHPNASLHHKDLDIFLGGYKGTPLGQIAYEVSDSIDNEMVAWFRQKYGSIPGNHRILSHGHTLGDAIPRDLLDAIAEKYGKEAVDDVIRQQQEVAGKYLKRIMETTGLPRKQSSALLRQFSNSHLLGDLMEDNKLTNLVKDFDSICESEIKIVDDLFGRTNPEYAKSLTSEIKALKHSSLTVAEKAERLTQILGEHKVDAAINKSYGNVFKRTTRPVTYSIDRAVNRNALLHERIAARGVKPKTPARINLGRAGVSVERGAASATGRGAAKATGRSLARSTGRSGAKALGRSAARAAERGVVKGAAKAGGRGVLSYLGDAAPIIVDAGFWIYGDYKIDDEYTRGLISETERVEKKYVNNGRAIGGAVGAYGGASLGRALSSSSDNPNGSPLAILICAVIGGLAGDYVGSETAQTVYETVNRPAYEVCCEACNIGDVDAMFFNGLYHHEGRHVDRDLEVAQQWFSAAACQGDVRAQFYCGEYCYSNDVEKAAFWWGLAANSESSERKFKECKASASYNLAMCYLNGEGVEQDELKALYYLSQAAANGNEGAIKALKRIEEECSKNAESDEPDVEALKICGHLKFYEGDADAYKYYLRAADLGDADAIFSLGLMHMIGLGMEKDEETAFSFFRWAADLGHEHAMECFIGMVDEASSWKDNIDWLVEKANDGYRQALCKLAFMAIAAKGDQSIHDLAPFKDVGNDDLNEMAIRLFERAEELGSDVARACLAEAFEDEGVRAKLRDRSVQTYEQRFVKAAFSNNSDAQLMYAAACESGAVLKKDISAAAFWYALAALNGNAVAQYEFGRCCHHGIGTPANQGKAVNWWRMAVGQKNARAMVALSECYKEGNGVSKDTDKAEELIKQAGELADMGTESDAEGARRVFSGYFRILFYAEPDVFIRSLPENWVSDASAAAAEFAKQFNADEWAEFQKVVDLFGRCLVIHSDMIAKEMSENIKSGVPYKPIIENWGEKLCGISKAATRDAVMSGRLAEILMAPKHRIGASRPDREFRMPVVGSVKVAGDMVFAEISDYGEIAEYFDDCPKCPNMEVMRKIGDKVVDNDLIDVFAGSSSWKLAVADIMKELPADERPIILIMAKCLSEALENVSKSKEVKSMDDAVKIISETVEQSSSKYWLQYHSTKSE